MQRLFVMFPDRAPGIGLLWLRLCLAAALCWPWPVAAWQQWVAASAALLLALGGLTPLAVALATLVLWTGKGGAALVLLPACLLLLGPGAYSLDACLFGRRVLLAARRMPPPKE